jgi:hypothetical protein
MRSEIDTEIPDTFKTYESKSFRDSMFLNLWELDVLTIFHLFVIFLVLIHLFYFIYMMILQNLHKKKIPNEIQKPKSLRKINECCSICLEDVREEVQLLCSHSYCGKCIIEYGKRRWNFVDILCPICRSESKLIFSIFERNEDNKDIYEMVIKYNCEGNSNYPTSFCFCLDMVRLSLHYFKEFKNFSAVRYTATNKRFVFFILLVIFFLFYPLTLKFTSYLEFFEDLITYIFLIVLCSEYFNTSSIDYPIAEYDYGNINSDSTSENHTQTENLVMG